jgi:hypothetical protein
MNFQDAENGLQLRSHFALTLNVLKNVRFGPSLAAALPVERRVLARWGRAGEKVSHFDHPQVMDY